MKEKNTVVNFEMFGRSIVRFTLPIWDVTDIDRNRFANLFWLLQGEREDGNDNVESFTASVKEWKKAVRAFRIANTGKLVHDKEAIENWLCPLPRVKGSFVSSGFEFRYIEQRTEESIVPACHNIGNANHETITDNWTGFKSQLEPVESD